MPRMDGLELISKLRAMSPTLPIVLLSGFTETLGLAESATGADVVLQKSANEITHLVRAVSRLLRRKKPPASQPPLKAKRKTV
jgi:CheY-like chemotaxis protein